MKNNIVLSIVLILLGLLLGCKSVKQSDSKTSVAVEEYKGIDGYILNFRALGHEPEWNVKVTHDQIVYQNINLKDPIIFKNVKSNPIMDITGMGYHAVDSNGQTIRVQVIKDRCTDTMDDTINPFSVDVMITSGTEQGLAGCGIYELDERLGNTWYMLSFRGLPIEAVNAGKRPIIAFDLDTKRVNANMGCNGIGGSYEVMENHIYFDSNFMATQMYCEGAMELEKSFTELISGKTVIYNIKNEKLVFTNLEGVELAVFSGNRK